MTAQHREMSAADQRLLQGIAGDLLGRLSYSVVELGDMSLKEQARLAALVVKYKASQAGRRILQALGVFPPN